jgi:hypothetical protein
VGDQRPFASLSGRLWSVALSALGLAIVFSIAWSVVRPLLPVLAILAILVVLGRYWLNRWRL